MGCKILKQLIKNIQKNNIRDLWFKVLGRTIYRRLILFERDLKAPISNINPGIPIKITLLKDNEIDDYIRFRPDVDYIAIQRRFEKNAQCFVVRYENKIVHAGWAFAKSAWIDYLKYPILLSDDEIYTSDSFTSPEFRGFNVAAARIIFTIQYFNNLGYGKLLCGVLKENKPAFRPLEKTGWIPCGVISCLMIGPWRYHF